MKIDARAACRSGRPRPFVNQRGIGGDGDLKNSSNVSQLRRRRISSRISSRGCYVASVRNARCYLTPKSAYGTSVPTARIAKWDAWLIVLADFHWLAQEHLPRLFYRRLFTYGPWSEEKKNTRRFHRNYVRSSPGSQFVRSREKKIFRNCCEKMIREWRVSDKIFPTDFRH